MLQSIEQTMDADLRIQDGERGGDGDCCVYVVPFVPGPCKLCPAWFQKPGPLTGHHRMVHSDVGLAFACGTCSRSFRGYHAVACHRAVADCRESGEVLAFPCEICQKSFHTRSGLSQHKRHMHIAARVEERAAPRSGPRNLRSKWTQEEKEAVMSVLTAENPPIAYTRIIIERGVMKTPKQIRSFVAMLRGSGELPGRVLDPEGLERASEEEDRELAVAEHDEPDELLAFGPQMDNFREDIRDYWLGQPIEAADNATLCSYWAEVSYPDQEWVDSFVWRVTSGLLAVMERVEADRRAGAAGARRRIHTGRGKIKAQKYASVQEMFRRCPGKLAEKLIKGGTGGVLGGVDADLPANEIREVYSRLWGDVGRSDFSLRSRVSERQVAPVTVCEVARRIKKLKPRFTHRYGGLIPPL